MMASELNWTDWFSMFASLLLVLGLLVATLLLLKRFGLGYRIASGEQIKIIDAKSLGARQKLLLIAVRGEEILIGLSPQGISQLGNWPQPENNQAVELQTQQPASGKLDSFKQALIGANKAQR